MTHRRRVKQITTLDDLKQAIAVLPTVRPTMFGAVPQVWYKLKAAIDKTLADAALRSKYGITVVSIKRPGEDFTYATADTTVYAGDILIVAGKTRHVEAFANLT